MTTEFQIGQLPNEFFYSVLNPELMQEVVDWLNQGLDAFHESGLEQEDEVYSNFMLDWIANPTLSILEKSSKCDEETKHFIASAIHRLLAEIPDSFVDGPSMETLMLLVKIPDHYLDLIAPVDFVAKVNQLAKDAKWLPGINAEGFKEKCIFGMRTIIDAIYDDPANTLSDAAFPFLVEKGQRICHEVYNAPTASKLM